jgi:hypothetical protein
MKKNTRNIKSFNEPAFCSEFVKRGWEGGFRARNITLAREDWQN